MRVIESIYTIKRNLVRKSRLAYRLAFKRDCSTYFLTHIYHCFSNLETLCSRVDNGGTAAGDDTWFWSYLKLWSTQSYYIDVGRTQCLQNWLFLADKYLDSRKIYIIVIFQVASSSSIHGRPSSMHIIPMHVRIYDLDYSREWSMLCSTVTDILPLPLAFRLQQWRRAH